MKILIFIDFIFCLFLSTICTAESGINLVELKTNIFEEAPEVNWIYHVCMSSEVFGQICI